MGGFCSRADCCARYPTLNSPVGLTAVLSNPSANPFFLPPSVQFVTTAPKYNITCAGSRPEDSDHFFSDCTNTLDTRGTFIHSIKGRGRYSLGYGARPYTRLTHSTKVATAKKGEINRSKESVSVGCLNPLRPKKIPRNS